MRDARLPANPDVVIVGAGAAGIGAAQYLIGHGIDVVIVEAADRIGGRAYCETGSFGVPFDNGCAWLQGPADLPYVAFARAHGFALVDHADPPDALFNGACRASPAEIRAYEAAGDDLARAIEGAQQDVAVAQLFDVASPWHAAAATWLGPMDHSVDLDALSSADVKAYGAYDVNMLVPKGLGTLVAQYGAGLPVRLGAPVSGIGWGGRGVSVRTQQGDLQARAAIVTVSTGVMAAGQIRFDPPLPPRHQDALDGLPMGLLCKIALQLDGARFGLPENAFLTRAVHEPLPARACFFLSFPTGYELCVGFVGGQQGWEIERAGEAAAVDLATSELAAMLGSDVRRRVLRGRMTGWGANPLTRGAYAAARPGRYASRAALALPLADRVFFAGEALGGAYPALLSGAHLSGVAAARSVMAAFGQTDA